jgi:hypothetical protein
MRGIALVQLSARDGGDWGGGGGRCGGGGGTGFRVVFLVDQSSGFAVDDFQSGGGRGGKV